MSRATPIYIAGSALLRALQTRGDTNLLTRTHAHLDLTNQAAVNDFFAAEKPELVNLGSSCIHPKPRGS